MPNGEAHEEPKSKASRSVKTPLQKEALEAAYSSKPSQNVSQTRPATLH